MGGQLRVYADVYADPDVPGSGVWFGSFRVSGAGPGDGELQHCVDKVSYIERGKKRAMSNICG